MALPAIPPPPAWELYLPPSPAVHPAMAPVEWSAAWDGSGLPLALLHPLAPVFGWAEAAPGENFLAGLTADKVVGTAVLSASALRHTSVAWIGIALRGSGRFFEELRRGCWVCGFPAVGWGRELLRRGNLADPASLSVTLAELNQPAPSNGRLFLNFHYDKPAAACDRVYLLDAGAGRLHGFAFPRSALAPASLK